MDSRSHSKKSQEQQQEQQRNRSNNHNRNKRMIQQQKQNINRIIAGVTGDVAQIIGTTPNMSQQEDEGD